MRCEEAQEQLSEFLDALMTEGLTAEESGAFAHLQSCPMCRSEWEPLRAAIGGFRVDLPAPSQATRAAISDIAKRALAPAEVKTSKEPRGLPGWLSRLAEWTRSPQLAMASVLVLVLALGVWSIPALQQRSTRDPMGFGEAVSSSDEGGARSPSVSPMAIPAAPASLSGEGRARPSRTAPELPAVDPTQEVTKNQRAVLAAKLNEDAVPDEAAQQPPSSGRGGAAMSGFAANTHSTGAGVPAAADAPMAQNAELDQDDSLEDRFVTQAAPAAPSTTAPSTTAPIAEGEAADERRQDSASPENPSRARPAARRAADVEETTDTAASRAAPASPQPSGAASAEPPAALHRRADALRKRATREKNHALLETSLRLYEALLAAHPTYPDRARARRELAIGYHELARQEATGQNAGAVDQLLDGL